MVGWHNIPCRERAGVATCVMAAVWFLVSGCAVRDHVPCMPRTFMREGMVFEERPPAEGGTGVNQSTRKSQPAPTAHVSIGFAEEEEDAIRETSMGQPETLPAPTPRGITLDDAIDATLSADPKLQA